jgi:stage III sporulation protein AB
MLRLAGALLTAAACVALGYIFSRELRRHCELLAALQQGFLLLEKEISFAATPLTQALKTAAAGAGTARELFAACGAALGAGLGLSAAEAWQQALQPWHNRLAAEEYALLSAFAAGLGLSDSAHQLKRIELTRLKLAAAEALAREHYARQGRVRQSLGWAAGAALILLFL